MNNSETEVLTAPKKETGSDIVKVATDIQSGLAVFESRKAAVAAKVERYSILTIKDATDKEGYKTVKEARLDLMRERTATEKEGKSMRDPLTQTNKFISAKEKELIEVSQAEELRLSKLEKDYEAELERIKQEEIQKEIDRKQKMVDQLAVYGMPISISQLENVTDSQFQESLAYAKEAFEKKEAERIAEEKRIADEAEAERLAKEAEAKRLQEERAELEKMIAENKRLKEEQEAREREMDKERARLADIKLALKLEKRRNQLNSIGCNNEFGNDSFKYKDRSVATYYDIHDKNDSEWDQFFATLQPAIEKYESDLKEAEQKRLDDLAKAAEEARLKAIQDAKDAEAKRIEEERKKKEAEESKAARQPDKVKIAKYIESIQAIAFPELKTDDGKSAMQQITSELIIAFENAKKIVSVL